MTRIKKGLYLYKGAGILICCRNREGIPHMLLGFRKDRPIKHTWSIPGGGGDPGESPVETALRETREETRFWSGAPALQAAELQELHHFRLPFFDWHTYLWIVENPDLEAVGVGFPAEFTEFRWFPLDKAPWPRHFGMMTVIRKARRILG